MKTSSQKRKLNPQSEVQAARGRLRGALNDSLQNDQVDDIDEDYEEEDEPMPTAEQKLPQRGRPRKHPRPPTPPPPPPKKTLLSSMTPSKKRKKEKELAAAAALSSNKIQAESFVMKLFDRSLDLSKYAEQTPLYPICRSWIVNQPRNPTIRNYRDQRSPSPVQRKDNGGEILAQLRNGNLREVLKMPKAKKAEVDKIPSPPVQPKKYTASEELIKPNDQLKDADKEEILKSHLTKWKKVKRNWQTDTKLYQKRNDVNFLILQELFKS